MDARKYLAELIGTFILVLVGSMSIVAAGMMGPVPVSPLVVAPFGFGLGLLAAIQVAGYVSGGHFNPAVTLAALLDKQIEPMNAIGYWVAQVVGAIAASGLLLLISNQAAVASTASSYPAGQGLQALIVEIDAHGHLPARDPDGHEARRPNQAAFAIPLTLDRVHFAGIPFSGASVNPARSLAPALIGGTLNADILIWIIGPLVGGAIGWGIYRALEDGSDPLIG